MSQELLWELSKRCSPGVAPDESMVAFPCLSLAFCRVYLSGPCPDTLASHPFGNWPLFNAKKC
jgi:hypothetical protein